MKFTNIEKYLKPHNIIYFEDPFGKTEYEVTADEGIIRNIASVIETVENTDDTYVIITSRDEVFMEFRRKIIFFIVLNEKSASSNRKRDSSALPIRTISCITAPRSYASLLYSSSILSNFSLLDLLED